MNKFSKCIIHIGTEKTGTTSIQECMSFNRELLAESGIYYPKSLGIKNHIKLAVYACDDTRINQELHRTYQINSSEDLYSFREQLTISLASELETIQTKNLLLLSNEHLQSRLYDEREIQRLIDFIKPHAETIEILVYLRRQDKMAISAYSTLLKCGSTRKTVIPQKEDSDYEGSIETYFNFKKLLTRWENVVGFENIKVRLFDKKLLIKSDVVLDYLHEVGINESISHTLTFPKHENESLLPIAQEFLITFNEYFPQVIDNQNNPYKASISTLLEKHFGGKGRQVTKQAAFDFYQIFKADNDFVARKYLGIKELFTENFDEYAEVDTTEINVDGAFQVALALWEEKQKQVLNQRTQLENLRKQAEHFRIEAMFANGRVLKLEKNYKAAEEKFLKVIQLAPNHSRAYKNMAEIMEIRGDFNQAIDYIDKAIALEDTQVLLDVKAKILKKC